MPERVVKTTLIIDDHGAVRVVKGVGEESARTEGKLSHLDKSARGLGKTFGGLKGMIAGGLGALGVGGFAFGLADIVSKTKEIALETEQFRTQTGLSTATSLYYTKALHARGLTTEQVGKAFGILAKNVRTAELQEEKFGKAQVRAVGKGKELTAELGRQAKAFQELGINATGFASLSETQKLERITKAFEALPDGMKKSRLERELFGRGGNQLSIVLDKGNLGLSHQIELVKKFFPTIKGGANAMNELLEKQTESKMAWEGLQLTIGMKLIPVITSLMSHFTAIAQEVEKGKGKWGELRKTFESIVGAVKQVWGWFENLVGPTNALKIAVGGLLGVMVVSKVLAFASAIKVLSIAGVGGFAWAAPLVAAAGALAVVNKLMPPGSKINNLLGGNQPGEAGREGEVYAKAHGGFGTPAMRAEQKGFITGGVQAGTGTSHTKVELHVDGHKLAEALLGNTRARRSIAEATTIYAHGMAARGHG